MKKIIPIGFVPSKIILQAHKNKHHAHHALENQKNIIVLNCGHFLMIE